VNALNKDFTIKKYIELIKSIQKLKYNFVTMENFISNKLWNDDDFYCVLRHDIDKRINNSVITAKIENEFGIRSTYYARYVKKVYDVEKLKQIEALGHEIGFHYETLDKAKGDFDKALSIFEREISEIRKDFNIKTICMHGFPLTPWKNVDIWKKFDYRRFEIIGEPYLDVDYTKTAYFTDTGRSWDSATRVKDIIPKNNYNSKHSLNPYSTNELIKLISNKKPQHIIILTHPQRWNDNIFLWIYEYVYQNIKNIIKFVLIKHRNK